MLADGGFEPLGLLQRDDAGVTAIATSTYSGYPASNVLDLDVDTSWYIDSTCTAAGSLFCCEAESIRVNLPVARSVSAVVMIGNRGGFPSGYDLLTGRLDFLDAANAVITSRNVVFNRPNGDWAIELLPPISNVRAVRLVPGWAEASAPGVAEIRVYGQ
jgi:hypothetical protein